MATAKKIADRFGYVLGKMGHGDTRRIINHQSKPFYVAQDGRVIQQFSTAAERSEWLEGQELVADLPRHPEAKPMKIDP